MSNPN